MLCTLPPLCFLTVPGNPTQTATRVIAACCSVLQCVAVSCSVLQCVTVYCSVLQYMRLHNKDSNQSDFGMCHSIQPQYMRKSERESKRETEREPEQIFQHHTLYHTATLCHPLLLLLFFPPFPLFPFFPVRALKTEPQEFNFYKK